LRRRALEIEMKIRGLMMDPVTNMPIVILKDINGNSLLPIWVGIYEANAIALEIEKVATPRPMTHDLIKSLLLGLGTGMKKVVVSDLREDTFYAIIWLERKGADQRRFPPSDALALAAASTARSTWRTWCSNPPSWPPACRTRSTTTSCAAGWRTLTTKTSAATRCKGHSHRSHR
jgi:bifunctional DNase/RNase